MADTIITTFRQRLGVSHPIEELRLLPADGGRFEVTIDGDLVYSKAATGQHTTNEHIVELIRQRLEV
jgi:selenoprotein W-related protein